MKVNKTLNSNNIDLTQSGTIPKIIHYCWFGKGEKPAIVKECIKSWRKFLPEWEIIEWNENNFNVNLSDYMKDAYSKKKWAFVSDIARLIVLYQNGGVYLDTDVELKSAIPKEWLEYNSFLFFEIESRINTGLGFGCKKRNSAIKYMIDDYSNISFIKENNKLNLTACTYYNTKSLEKYFKSLELNGKYQVIDNNAFIDRGTYNKIAIHHYASSWTDAPKIEIQINKKWHNNVLKKFLRNPKRQKWIRKHTSDKITIVYTFIAYDLLENGFFYYIKRWGIKYIIKSKRNNC